MLEDMRLALESHWGQMVIVFFPSPQQVNHALFFHFGEGPAGSMIIRLDDADRLQITVTPNRRQQLSWNWIGTTISSNRSTKPIRPLGNTAIHPSTGSGQAGQAAWPHAARLKSDSGC